MTAREILEAEDPKRFLKSLGPRPIVPRRLTWNQIERVADVLASGPLQRKNSDWRYLDCGLFVRYDGAPEDDAVDGAPGAAKAFYAPNGSVRPEWIA